jgi:hypothetical protein
MDMLHCRGAGRAISLQPAQQDPTLHSSLERRDQMAFDGDLYFTSGLAARKARNLAVNSACTLSVRLEGIDLILEGEASRITDQPTLEQAAQLYREGGWPAEVQGEAFAAPFSAPSAGPPPWQLYRFTFHTAFGVATAEPYGATRWRFDR